MLLRAGSLAVDVTPSHEAPGPPTVSGPFITFQPRRRFGRSLIVSAIAHVVIVTLVAVAIMRAPVPVPAVKDTVQAISKPADIPRLVFLATPGPGGGGGGGGNRQKEPIRRAEAPGHDELTLQVRRPIVIADTPAPPVAPAQAVVLDATPMASGTMLQPGLPSGGVSTGTSLGPGTGGGVGEGVGTGIGSGTGPGVGPGSGGGTGGGVYRIGSGVTAPQILRQVKPTYTTDALARKIQGSVELELVVTRTGLPTQIKIRHSLDAGLDAEAVKAVEQWRFVPGRLAQTPVDVWVVVILDFTIR